MKRRIVSILMALVMALSLLPAQALAEELAQAGQNAAYANGQDTALHAIAVQAAVGASGEANDASVLESCLATKDSYIKLTGNIELNGTLTIDYDVTLDLNNHILQMTNNGGSVFVIKDGGHLTLTDTAQNKTDKHFSVDNNTGLWKLTNDTTSTNTVTGGVITGGSAEKGGGVYIGNGGQLTLESGSIVGCTATHTSYVVYGGGVFVLDGQFNMTGGHIIGCTAVTQDEAAYGGGVYVEGGTFTMSGGSITDCTVAAQNEGWAAFGGGIRNHQNGSSTTLSGTAVIQNCHAKGSNTSGGGISDNGTLNISGDVQITDCTADGKSDAMFIGGGGAVNGGTFDGTVTNEGTITGGTFNGDVNNNGGKVTGGIFKGRITGIDSNTYIHVNNKDELIAALENGDIKAIRLNSDIKNISEALTITRTVTLDLNDHVLQMPQSHKESIFKIEATGHLTLTDSTAEESKTTRYFSKNDTGLWTLTDSNTAYSVTGGVITGGDGYKIGNSQRVEAYGGGVYIEDGGKLTMTGGHIVGCEARGYNAYGGGVFVSTNGTFTMSGGSITGCIAITTKDSAFGGGIRSAGNTTLSDTAVIRDCHAKGAGKGSYKLSGGGFSDGHINGTLSISGNVQIIGCTAGGKGSDAMVIMKANNRNIAGGTFYGSINGLNNATITGYTVTYRLNNEDYATQVVKSGSKISIPKPDKADHTFDGWYKADGTAWDHSRDTVTGDLTLTGLLYKGVGTEADFTKALNDKDVEAIRLTQNITLSSGEPNTGIDVAADRKVVLDLNGHVLDLWKKYISLAYDRSNTPNAKKQLTIVDSKPTQEHRFKDNDGLWVLDEQNGTKIVKGGVITGGSSTTTNGGAVYIDTNGTVIMTGGSIVGCTATNGGAVYMNGGAFEMNGGAIIGCKATNGGGVYVEEKGTFTMTDGSIADCAADQGSALYLKGRMNANGGTVDGTVVLVDTDDSERGIQSVDRNNNATTRFTGTVTNNGGDIKHGTFGGLIINNKTNAGSFSVHSPLGIVKNKPSNTNYRTVTFDLADGDKMGYTTRYFLDGGKISSEIKPTRTGYTFGGWYKADGTAWDHNSDTVTGDMTLAARWTACDHSGSTAQPTCTADATCSICGVTINALGHDWGAWVSNDNKTHTRACKRDSTHTETANCTDGNKDHVCDICDKVLSQHSGGTASCAAPATCGYCGKPYGEKNPANHSDLKHVPAKAATTQAEGNSEYWLCSGCGKCYKDAAAATEIALSDTVIAKRIPRRYSGPTITVVGAAYYDGGNVGLTFISSADFDTFTGVQVDGKTLAAKNYIAERGSIEVYLKAVYLRTLKNGSHTVTIQSTAGDVSAVFTVENSKTSPGTSDPGIAVYALSSMLSLTGLAALRRRKED